MSVDSKNKFKMVAVDLDGTLLQSNHQVSERTVEYFQHLNRKGFLICIATGRALANTFSTIQRLAFPTPIPVLCSNGSRGILCQATTTTTQDASSSNNNNHPTDNSQVDQEEPRICRELFSIPVPEQVAKRVIRLAIELGCVTQYYIDNDIYANPTTELHFELTERYKALTSCQTMYVQNNDFGPALARGLPSKQLVLCHQDNQDDVMQKFAQELGQEAYLVKGQSATIVRGSMGWFIEVLHPDICKGNGLKHLLNHFGKDLIETKSSFNTNNNHNDDKVLEMKDCIAFGDGDNDLEFIRDAGYGIVMKNGRDCVKEVADRVIDFTNDEDGVQKTLQQLESEGKLEF